MGHRYSSVNAASVLDEAAISKVFTQYDTFVYGRILKTCFKKL